MSARAVPDVRAAISRVVVPVGAKHCKVEKFPIGEISPDPVVRELTAAEFADWQTDSESSRAGAMYQQIDFVGRCLCRADLAPVGSEFAGDLPRTVMQRASEVALRLNGLAADIGGEKKA